MYLAPPAAAKTYTSAAIILSLKVDLSFKNLWTNLCTCNQKLGDDSAFKVQAQLYSSVEY